MTHATAEVTWCVFAELLQQDKIVFTKANLSSLRPKLCRRLQLHPDVHGGSALKVCFSRLAQNYVPCLRTKVKMKARHQTRPESIPAKDEPISSMFSSQVV